MIRTWWSSFEVEVRFKELQWSEQVVIRRLIEVCSTKMKGQHIRNAVIRSLF